MKRAFTLVELLIVVAIIGILASVTLMALSQAQGQAKIYRTQTTIAKIDAALTEVYERFEFRSKTGWQVPCPTSSPPNNCPAHPRNKRTIEARARYLILREEMRLEMPQMGLALNPIFPAEFIAAIAGVCSCPVSSHNIAAYETSVETALKAAEEAVATYQDAITAAGVVPTTASSAEMLYLVIETSNPEAIANFKGGEIGDTDGNGLFEFVDAWGNPIRFMRFAAGLQDSQRQPVIPEVTLNSWQTDLATGAPPQATIDAMLAISTANPDPLYPQQAGDPNPILRCQWLTFPVIYSLGADGVAGIREAPDGGPPPPRDVNALVPISATNIRLGAPLPVGHPNYGCDRDNVTNHNMTRPF